MQPLRTLLTLILLFSGSVYANVSPTANDHVNLLHRRHEVVWLLGQDPDDTALNPRVRGHLYFRLGLHDLRSQRYADAIDDFSRALSLDPHINDYVNRGIAYEQLGNPEQALTNYAIALSFNPKSISALQSRAQLYAEHKQPELAIQDYSSVLALRPDNAFAYFKRAALFFDLQRYLLSASDYTAAAQLRPDDIILYRLAGFSYDRGGHYTEAIASYTTAIRLAPEYAHTYTQRGAAYLHSGDDGHALEDFSSAIRRNPAEVDARLERALMFEAIQQLDLAIDDYSAILSVEPNRGEAYFYRADDLSQLGRDDEALRDYDRASRIAPDDLLLRSARMRFSFYQGDYLKSIADADRWLQLTGQQGGVPDAKKLYVLAWRHMASQRLGSIDHDSLAADASRLNHDVWPYPVIAYYLGEINDTQLQAAAKPGDPDGLLDRQCEADAYLGESYMADHHDVAAKQAFETAMAICPETFIERTLAQRELAHLEKAKDPRVRSVFRQRASSTTEW